MSSKKSKPNTKPKESSRLLTQPKYNYQSSDNGGTTTPSVAGIGYSQYSDDNVSEHQNRNKNQSPFDNSMYRARNNPNLISNKFNTNDRHNRYYRRKKHKNKSSEHKQHQPPNMAYPPYYPYPYPPNTNNPTSQPYYPYPYPPPYPYPYPYPTVPAHGDVTPTSFTPPPSFHQNKHKHVDKNVGHSHQMPPVYYYPSPYYPHAPPHNQHDNNAPYPYNMNMNPHVNPYGHFGPPHYGTHPHKSHKSTSKHNKNIKLKNDIDMDIQDDNDIDTPIENAEPADDDVNSRNKLFSDLGNDGYENDEVNGNGKPTQVDIDLFETYNSSFASQKNKFRDNRGSDSQEMSASDEETRTNCFKLCILLCDMENAFEVIEILILLVFISFIAIWWVDRENTVLLLSLAGCSSIFGILVINMRRAQSSLRLHELGSTLNDFRFILFTIGLCVVISADQMRYVANENEDIKYLWIAHSFVWIIAGMLWCTIDFATYMSYFVSTSYHIFIFIGTLLEFSKVCYQIHDPNDIPKILYKHNSIIYDLYDFKIDGLLLMLMVEISTIITLIRDSKREWYCFGLSHVYRHRLLQISHRQERMINDRMFNYNNYNIPQNRMRSYNNNSMRNASIGSSHLVHNMSGNKYFYMFGNNEDSLLLIWIINLSIITYLTFFIWDAHSEYKSIPSSIGILSFIILIYRECDFHLIPLMKQQTHFWFISLAIIELWFCTIYSSIYVGDQQNEMWKDIGSSFIDCCMLTIGIILIFLTDILISSVSSYFIIRGTIPLMILSISLFSSWYLSFNSQSINKIKWPITIIIRNAYYIIITMCCVSIIKWIRDPIHKYFIYILDRRKRTILYEHRYRDQHASNNKLLFGHTNDTRDHSITLTRNNSQQKIITHHRPKNQNNNEFNYDNRMQRLTRQNINKQKSRNKYQDLDDYT